MDGAFEEGVRRVVVTHPEFPCQDFSLEEQRELAGARLPARALPQHSAAAARRRGSTSSTASRAVGAERTLFSSDCGNPDYPAVEDGLALLADRLLGAGFDEDEVREMIVGRSRQLAGAE